MEAILEMLQELGKLSPFIILMGIFVYYLYQRKNELYTELKEVRKEKEEITDKLNSEIRTIEKDTLSMLSKLTDTLGKLHNNDKIFQMEIKNLRDFIQMKFDLLNINKNNDMDNGKER